MARRRNISPEFFTDSEIGRLSLPARLLFIALWCLADRRGRLKLDTKELWVKVFPYDRDLLDVDPFLEELCQDKKYSCEPFVARYEVDGVEYVEIQNFLEYQSPHPKEKDSELPAPNGGATLHIVAPKKLEFVYRNLWASELDGKVEVTLDSGICDIVTESHCWEVKTGNYWKSAIGQALAYAGELSKRPGIILFGNISEKSKQQLEATAALSCIDVLWGKPGESTEQAKPLKPTQVVRDHSGSGSSGSGSSGSGSSGSRARVLPDPAELNDPEAITTAVINEINHWLPDQRLKLTEGLMNPIANLLLCGDPGGITKIRGDPQLLTLPDLIDLAHGYIVAESTNHWHIEQRARGQPYAFARLVRDSGRVSEYAETGRKLWDSWHGERSAEDEKAEAIAKCQRDHESEKEQRGVHWVCPALCGWKEVIRTKVEEPV